MIESLCKEIELQKNYLNNQPIETIYFGGGTPSILKIEEVKQILDAIHAHFNTDQLKEITLEANPDDITKSNILTWKNNGVNRLSIGLQSFKEDDLKWMNRAHTVNEALNCVRLAIENGIKNLTVDLIYGLPNLTNEEWIHHIETVIRMGVQHVSAYCLTVEEGTALDKFVEKGKVIPASENNQAEQFLLLIETLEKHGFSQYEISNFCKPGFESIHNSNYWKGVHYLGIGPSAHSYNGHSRSWNVRNNHSYMNSVANETSWFETEELTKNDIYNELLLTGLRTIYGVNLNQLNMILPLDETFYTQIENLCSQQLMEKDSSSIRLTKVGRLQADRIASDLFRVE
jgi:oxygen-independent coproporphyrinogen-3 oxidase